jgi:mannose-1-phosphate guanylyltransferase
MRQASAEELTGQLWAVVLAGGEGLRLRPLIERLYGEPRPKQFASLVGFRSLLRQTLDRVQLAVPSRRTVVVGLTDHDGYLAEALEDAPVRHVLRQPEDRETGAGVLLPAHWIHARDPHAVVAVFPSDHFIDDDQALMQHVADMAEVIEEHPDWLALLGAAASEPEPDYGWIEPGEIVGWSPAGEPISRVRQFLEKPSPLTAHACLQKGWLWNTFVLVAKASLLVHIGSRFLPEVHESLSRIRPLDDAPAAADALREAYRLFPKASFSRAVLEFCPAGLVVSRLPMVSWSDWGTPERVVKSLRKAGLLPRWFGESDIVGQSSGSAGSGGGRGG